MFKSLIFSPKLIVLSAASRKNETHLYKLLKKVKKNDEFDLVSAK